MLLNVPKCSNNQRFVLLAAQCAEDGCEVWLQCADCEYNPFEDQLGSCIECVWGQLDEGNFMLALSEWTALINKENQS